MRSTPSRSTSSERVVGAAGWRLARTASAVGFTHPIHGLRSEKNACSNRTGFIARSAARRSSFDIAFTSGETNGS